tara:strand:- start:28 stop:462 length:435 start_codon:yes stop_codon:yes gene_type:complete
MAFQGTLTGNLGKEPELITFEDGKMKVELRVAVKQRKKDAPAFWVQVDMWGKQAEFAMDYLHKGDTIYAQGTVTEQNFTRRNGESGHKVVLVYSQVEIIKSKDREEVKPEPTPTPTPTPTPQPVVKQQPKAGFEVVPEYDEIPF